jgi:Ni/Fe-hydrogenase subunit HybB-like protein
MAWFLIPVPVPNWIWPNFRSPLMWDVFAVSTYFTVSVLFWYLGLVPDLATMRDRAKTQVAKVSYGLLALGWNQAGACTIRPGLMSQPMWARSAFSSLSFSYSSGYFR